MAYPKDLPSRYRKLWDKPWEPEAYRSLGFRRWLKKHGYLSPHFKTSEARCKTHARDGCNIPFRHRWRARRHAFRLEKVRHWTGDKPVQIISWYRCPRRNREVGGASQSRHMIGDATDHPIEWVRARGGQDRLVGLARKAGHRGIGKYPGGNLHFDDRARAATWSTW